MQQSEAFRMPFGKYNGDTFNEILEITNDGSYFNFLLSQEWFKQKDELRDFINTHQVDLTLNFGKYKGMRLSQVDDGYAKFLQDNNIVDEAFFF